MLRILILQFILVLFCGSQSANLFAQEITTVSTADSLSLPFLNQVQHYQDHTGKLDIKTIAWAKQQGMFKSYDQSTPADTTKVKATWFAITIPATKNLDQLWYLTSKKMPQAFKCYLQQTDQSYQLQTNEQQIPTKDFYFQTARWTKLLPPSTTTCQLLLRVQSNTEIPTTFQLETAKTVQQATNQAYLKIGLWYGALVALFFYHFFLLIVHRKSIYLFYCLLVGSIGLWCLAQMAGIFFLLDWSSIAHTYLGLLASYAVAISYLACAAILLPWHIRQNKLLKGILALLVISFLFFLSNINLFHAETSVILFSSTFGLTLITTFFGPRQKESFVLSFFWIQAIVWLSITLCATSLVYSAAFTNWNTILNPSFFLNCSFLSALLFFASRQAATTTATTANKASEKRSKQESSFSTKTFTPEITPTPILVSSTEETEIEVEIS
ncbi:MAG: 7TM-DISM domain-containing protein [Saprospiraceae bacterium]